VKTFDHPGKRPAWWEETPSVNNISSTQQIEISIKGRWMNVPALTVNGHSVIVQGKWLKRAMVHGEAWLENEVADPEPYLVRLTRGSLGFPRADFFTFAQKLPDAVPKYRYPMEWESIAAARVTSSKQWWDSLPQETRKNVRRAAKRGLEARVTPFGDELIRAIKDINDDSAILQGMRNVHYGKSLDQIKKDYGSFQDRSDFVVAYLGAEAVGFVKLVYRGGIASILHLTTKHSHYDKRPSNLLIAHAAELCAAKGMSHLTYGLFNYGNKRDNPLREFKTRNGFEEVLIPRFYVPLTKWGGLSIKLKLHRGLIGILPHRAIMLGVNARKKLYGWMGSNKPV
jgi:hypothetical protein